MLPVQSFAKKYFAFAVGQIISTSSPRPVPKEGRCATSSTLGAGCGGRFGGARRAARSGRRSRVVLTPRRWRQASRKYPRGDGGKKARSPGRARYKPLKPFACGNAG